MVIQRSASYPWYSHLRRKLGESRQRCRSHRAVDRGAEGICVTFPLLHLPCCDYMSPRRAKEVETTLANSSSQRCSVGQCCCYGYSRQHPTGPGGREHPVAASSVVVHGRRLGRPKKVVTEQDGKYGQQQEENAEEYRALIVESRA